MPRPPQMNPEAKKKEPMPPCVPSRGMAHHWVDHPKLEEGQERVVVDGMFTMRCTHCRRHRQFPTGLSSWEVLAAPIVITSDRLLRRTYDGASSLDL